MSFGLKTNNDSIRDFSIGEGGTLLLTIDEDTIVERLRTRLNKWLGYWYLDITEGIDYKNKVLGQNVGGSEISATLRREILLEKGVRKIQTFSVTQETANPRGFVVAATVELTNGETAEVSA